MDAILYHCTNAEKVKWMKKKILLLATIPKNQLLTRTITSDKWSYGKNVPDN